MQMIFHGDDETCSFHFPTTEKHGRLKILPDNIRNGIAQFTTRAQRFTVSYIRLDKIKTKLSFRTAAALLKPETLNCL